MAWGVTAMIPCIPSWTTSHNRNLLPRKRHATDQTTQEPSPDRLTTLLGQSPYSLKLPTRIETIQQQLREQRRRCKEAARSTRAKTHCQLFTENKRLISREITRLKITLSSLRRGPSWLLHPCCFN